MATSNARNVQLESEQPSALDQHPGVKQYFDRAQGLDAVNDQAHAQGRGSQMVDQDRPEPELKPGPELAAATDRQSFNERWKNEQDAARQAYLDRYDQQKDRAENERSDCQGWENSR